MAKFSAWCNTTNALVKNHKLCTLAADAAKATAGIATVAKAVPHHYASEERIAALLKRLGKRKSSEYVARKLPTSTSIRSGDLGEILGTNYVSEFTEYGTGVFRLRWKDHRNMAMRGDDIIGVKKVPGKRKPRFLKGEAKSSVSLTTTIVDKARKALRKDNNRPSPHALSFLADRLHARKKTELANLIDDAQLVDGIELGQVEHLLFVFSGNDATALLKNDLNEYTGRVTQTAVALVAKGFHQKFIKGVYEKVIADANNT